MSDLPHRQTLIERWPRYADGRPIQMVRLVGADEEEVFFVDWQRSRPHACLWYEYGLIDHVRCRLCGRVKWRE